MKKKASPSRPLDEYALALAREREAWEVLNSIPRSDPRFGAALSDWHASADRIEKLLRSPTKS